MDKTCSIMYNFLDDDDDDDFMELDSLEATTTVLSYKKLDLSDCGLEWIPQTVISTWTNLEELTLSENQLDVEHESVRTLLQSPNLRKLTLINGNLTTLPSYVHRLQKLEFLDVSNNMLTYLPENIDLLKSLTDLILDGNELHNLPTLNDMPKLRKLSAANNYLTNKCTIFAVNMRQNDTTNVTEVTDKEEKNQFVLKSHLASVNLKKNSLKGTIKLANYGNLSDLDLSENNIEKLDLSSLTTLKSIKCCKNQLTELTLSGTELISCIASNNRLKSLTIINHPTVLQHLDITSNELKNLPEWISKCNSLQTLAASHNRLTELPQDIFCNEESALDTLILSFNQLTVLPQIMRRVPIKKLYLQNNSLITLPRHFFVASSNLRTLNVSKNCLKELPQFISKNEKLEYLYITSNALTDITPLLNCTKLRTLHVAYNAISVLPEGCISCWSQIEELVISGNSLSYIPDNIHTWNRLKIFRAHSNLFTYSPSFIKNRSLKILDLSNNHLEKLDLSSFVPNQLLYLDISANTRLHVDSKDFYRYRSQRLLNLVDVSCHNRNSLPFYPIIDETSNHRIHHPWQLGFSETCGKNERLNICQLRIPEFCTSEALIGLFDSPSGCKSVQQLIKIIPRILLEERSVQETASDYMRYTLLSAFRELKNYPSDSEILCTLCHISKNTEPFLGTNNSVHRYILRVAAIGDTTTILCRDSGSLTLSHTVNKNPKRTPLADITHEGKSGMDPRITEISLHDHDQFLLLANKSLWEVISIEEAVAEVRSVLNPGLAAKRLQDLAQSYGCESNLSIAVLRFNNFQSNHEKLNRELKYTLKSANRIRVPINVDQFYEYEEDSLMHAEPIMTGSCRSSPSGQSDKGIINHNISHNYDENAMRNYHSYRKYSQPLPFVESNDCAIHGSLRSLPDIDQTYSDKSTVHVSEERFKCWEYMLEQNTQMLFDKELDTLSRSFTKRTIPSRPELWTPHAKSVSHLPDCHQSSNPTPFLAKRFGSARSYNNGSRLLNLNRRSLNGGPNAAYFGSLQRLMPYHLEYNFSEIKEKFDSTLDSLEQDGRMHKYWDVATTEL